MFNTMDLTEEEALSPYVDIEKDEKDETPDDNDYKLNNYGIDFDVNGLVRRLKNNSIYLPNFQRNYVWSFKKASKFIESLLLGLPVPGVFLYKEEVKQKMLIIDGYQRLETLKRFYQGTFGKKAFLLTDVVQDFKHKSYNDLPEDFQRKLDDTLLHATIIKADDPKEKNFNAIYMIFERLNTGGMNLSPQEIRNCVSHGDLQKILINYAKDDTIKSILKMDPKRKKDQEIILRFISLTYNHKIYNGNMKQFLNTFMFDNRDVKDENLKVILNEFKEVVGIISKIDIDEIIRPNGSLNIAILDAIWVGIAKSVKQLTGKSKTELLIIIKKLFADTQFKNAITTGKTHHKDSVINRIDVAIEYFKS